MFFRAKYDKKFKNAVVPEYLSNKIGDNGLIKKFSHNSAEFKLRVLEHMWREDLSFSQTVALFDLRGDSGVVPSWERKYYEGGITALASKPRGRPKQMKSAESPVSHLASSRQNLKRCKNCNEKTNTASIGIVSKKVGYLSSNPAARGA